MLKLVFFPTDGGLPASAVETIGEHVRGIDIEFLFVGHSDHANIQQARQHPLRLEFPHKQLSSNT